MRGRRFRPLAVAAAAALLSHALWLAHAQLRQRQTRPESALRSRDDTPELLVFSRQLPEPLESEALPPPPPEAPPPPPLPPRGGSRPGATATAKPAQAPARSQAAGRRRGKASGTALKPPPPKSPPRRPGGPPQGRAGGGRSGAGATATATAKPPEPLERLRRLQQPRRGEGDGEGDGPAPLEDKALRSWRSLWETATVDPQPPAALAQAPEGAQLRRIPLARARAEGLDPRHGQVLRLDDQLLLTWIEGSQLWLLRAPAAPLSPA